MNARSATGLLFLAIGLMAVTGPIARGQQPAAQPKDEALDSLLEKLSEPSDGSTAKAQKSAKPKDAKTEKSAKPEGAPSRKEEPKGADSKAKAKGQPNGQPDGTKPGSAGPPRATSRARSKPGGGAAVSDKDQELDDLLQKLGETKDAPSPDDRPRGGSGGGEEKQGPQPSQPDKAERNKLTGKDKETDEHLEELTGRRRKRKSDDGQRTGEVGEMIKEMRDVEEKLGKPDTGRGHATSSKRRSSSTSTP